MARIYMACLLAVALGACGGGGGATDTASAASTTTQQYSNSVAGSVAGSVILANQ